MSYFTPTAAGGRTGQVQEHKVYDATVSAGNLLRHTKVEQLTSDSMAVKEIRQYLTTTDFAASEMTYGERGNRTLGDFVFYRCHEFLVLLSKPYKHRA